MTMMSTEETLAAALPRRPISVHPPRSTELGSVGVLLLLFAMLAGVVAWLGPAIASDWRMRGDAVAAADIQVREAKCRSWLAALRFCSVTLAQNQRDGSERTLWYAFLGGAADQAVSPRRSASDPERVATDLGLENLLSRSVTLLLFAGVLLSCIAVAGMMLWSALAAQHAFAGMSGQRLMPVVVEIERHNRLPPRRKLWVYLYRDDRETQRALAEWPTKRQPLFTSSDERWALAVTGEDGGTPMLLDVDLACLDLTEDEKATFHAAVRARFGGRK